MQKTYTEAEESLLKEWGNERDFELEDAEVFYGTSGIKITALEQAKRRKQVHEPILNDPKFEILLNQLQMKKL